MGQNLTHGIYLPDEGERNCYDGLAGNWQLLDGAVGTIAEHTSQIAGKAPAVHTHTKSQITDFPAYGNTAGTICEGNDSRLSDARTPVAHTHSKADVTDLLNSNFIPSANNSYDLGSSSYQWNNLYAKNYYYNGIAWGLDKANVWSAENTFTANNINIQQPFTLGDNTYQVARLQILDSAPTPQRLGVFNFVHYTNNLSRLEMGIYGLNSNNEIKNRFLLFQLEPDETSSFFPLNNSQINLGTSTNKWKTLNGINPGALSLPNVNAVTGSSNTQLQDISGDLVQDQYFNCYFTPRMDGWVYIALDCSNATIRSGHSSYTVSVKTARGFANSIYTQSFTKNENAFSNVQIFIPVTANKEITLECSFTGFSVTKGYVIPCLGNV